MSKGEEKLRFDERETFEKAEELSFRQGLYFLNFALLPHAKNKFLFSAAKSPPLLNEV